MKPNRPAGPRLGELLETRGRMQRDILFEALRKQRSSGGRIGTCLVELEMVTEDDLLHVLSDQLKVPFTPPEDLRSLPEELIKLVPEKIARQRFSIPIRRSSTHLTIAMRDPADLLALDELAFVTGKRIRPQVASEIRILEALAKYYGVELASRFVNLLDRLNRERFFWANDGAAESEPSEIVDLPAFAFPPKAPDLRPHATAASPADSATRRAPSAQLAARLPSGEILAPIVNVFASSPATEAVNLRPTPSISPASVTIPVPIAPAPAPAAPAPPVAPIPGVAPVVSESAPAEPLPAPGAAPIQESLPIEEAEARLRDLSGRDEIGQLLLEYARGRVASALLLMVRRDEAAGWLGFGPGLDDESVESCKVELNTPSFVRALRDGAPSHRGALAEMPAHAEIRAMLGTNWATDLLALPLRMRERLVAVLIVTLEEGEFSPSQIEELARLVDKASVALELLVLKQKLQG